MKRAREYLPRPDSRPPARITRPSATARPGGRLVGRPGGGKGCGAEPEGL